MILSVNRHCLIKQQISDYFRNCEVFSLRYGLNSEILCPWTISVFRRLIQAKVNSNMVSLDSLEPPEHTQHHVGIIRINRSVSMLSLHAWISLVVSCPQIYKLNLYYPLAQYASVFTLFDLRRQ
jgi:hypothetical protein